MPGCSPAPNDQPSTLPGAGSYALALVLLYVHDPPGFPCQYDQWASGGDVYTHGSPAGWSLIRHTNPGCRAANV